MINIRSNNNTQLTNTYHAPINKYKNERKANYVDYSYLELVEKNISSKLDNILKYISELTMKTNYIQNLLINFGKEKKVLNSLEESYKNISEYINNISIKEKQSNNNEAIKKEKEFIKKEKIFVDGGQVYSNKQNISDFIVCKKKMI